MLPVSKIADVLIPLIFTANILPEPEKLTEASSFGLFAKFSEIISFLISNVKTRLHKRILMVIDFNNFLHNDFKNACN